MTYGTVNADVIATSTPQGILGAGNASIMKNRIINGAMVIDQRNAGASISLTGGGQFTVDRWRTGSDNTWASAVFSAQQNKGSVVLPAGFSQYLGIQTTTADSTLASTTSYLFTQPIEAYNMADLGWGTANAKTVTLSFLVYSNLTGTFGGSIQNSTGNYSYPFSYTVTTANTWTQCSVTIAGPTLNTVTWYTTNTAGMFVRFSLGAGSGSLGTAGAWVSGAYSGVTGQNNICASTANYLYITGVQLEVGSSATGFEYRQYGQELNLCQRYYWVNSTAIFPVTSYSGVFYGQNMRTNPTLGGGGAGFTTVQGSVNGFWAYQTGLAIQTITATAEL